MIHPGYAAARHHGAAHVLLVVETLDNIRHGAKVLETADRGQDRAGALILVHTNVPDAARIAAARRPRRLLS